MVCDREAMEKHLENEDVRLKLSVVNLTVDIAAPNALPPLLFHRFSTAPLLLILFGMESLSPIYFERDYHYESSVRNQ